MRGWVRREGNERLSLSLSFVCEPNGSLKPNGQPLVNYSRRITQNVQSNLSECSPFSQRGGSGNGFHDGARRGPAAFARFQLILLARQAEAKRGIIVDLTEHQAVKHQLDQQVRTVGPPGVWAGELCG